MLSSLIHSHTRIVGALPQGAIHDAARLNFSSSICPIECREFTGVGWDRLWSSWSGAGCQTEHRLHHGGRPRLCGREQLWPARLRNAKHRPLGDRRIDVHARLRELVRLLGDADGAGHRTISVSPRGRPRRADQCSTPKNIGLPPSHPTLPSLLKKAGYGTTLVCKWHLGFLPDFSPLKSGYDHFFGILGGAADYFNHGADHARTGAESYQLHEQEVAVERAGYMTNLLGDRAVQTVEGYAKSKEPFLMSLHFTAPHWPWEGPDDEAESKRIRNIFHRDGGTQKTYGTMVQSLDVNVGRVLQALDATGVANNTIIVFTSDNGGERFSKTWPFTGMKQELRRPSHSVDRALARTYRGAVCLRTGHDHDGLGADAAGRSRHLAGRGLSIRWRGPRSGYEGPRGTTTGQSLL